MKKNGKKKGVTPERYAKVIQSLIKEGVSRYGAVVLGMLRYYWFEWVEKPTYSTGVTVSFGKPKTFEGMEEKDFDELSLKCACGSELPLCFL